MGRKKTVPDAQIFQRIRALLMQGGDKAVSFSSVGRAIQLAPATLVQRYGSRDLMVQAALLDGWDALDIQADSAATEAPLTAKGALQMMKFLSDGSADIGLITASLRDGVTRARATGWRARVEAALALRLGGAVKGREAAAVLFAVWQGQALWEQAGEKGFRLKDAVKRIT